MPENEQGEPKRMKESNLKLYKKYDYAKKIVVTPSDWTRSY